MEIWQRAAMAIYGVLSLLVFAKGLQESVKKGNAFGKTGKLYLMGIFVWGDAVVIGPFWFLSSVGVFMLNDWLLFLLTISLFWVIRSLGETIYWLNQQFSPINRNPPANLPGYKFLKNDSLWFIYQTAWQCVSVISLIVTLYLARIWIQ